MSQFQEPEEDRFEFSPQENAGIRATVAGWLLHNPDLVAMKCMEHRRLCPNGAGCKWERASFYVLEKENPAFADAVHAEILILETARA